MLGWLGPKQESGPLSLWRCQHILWGVAFGNEIIEGTKAATSVLEVCHRPEPPTPEPSSSVLSGKSASPRLQSASPLAERRTESLALFPFLPQLPGSSGKSEGQQQQHPYSLAQLPPNFLSLASVDAGGQREADLFSVSREEAWWPWQGRPDLKFQGRHDGLGPLTITV